MPLEVWGPSGSREDMGTAHFVEHFLEAYNWDYMTRAVKVNPIPGGIVAHEFDFKGENQVVYKENGVTVWNLTRDGVTERMAVSTDEAWDVPGAEKGLEPDKSRKPEIIWQELVNQRLDMTEVNKRWLDEYKKEHGLK